MPSELEEFKNEILDRLTKHEDMTGKIYAALVGDKALGNEGIVNRLHRAEKYIENDKKHKWYLMGGLATISAGVTHFIGKIFNP